MTAILEAPAPATPARGFNCPFCGKQNGCQCPAPKAQAAPAVCVLAADGCPMSNGGACPTDQSKIDQCPEC